MRYVSAASPYENSCSSDAYNWLRTKAMMGLGEKKGDFQFPVLISLTSDMKICGEFSQSHRIEKDYVDHRV